MKSTPSAADKAWATRCSPVYKARRTSDQSRDALAAWCKRHRWHLVPLDAESGNPRVGIIDAVMLRLRSGEPDKLEMKRVQPKGGAAGLTAKEWTRLNAAAHAVSVEALGVLTAHEPGEPSFLVQQANGSVAVRRTATKLGNTSRLSNRLSNTAPENRVRCERRM